MDFPTVILLVFLIYFVEWFYITYTCENQVVPSSTNQSTWTNLDLCFTSYSSFGLIYIINKISFSLIYLLDKISFGLSRIFDEPFTTAIIVLIGLFSCGAINRQSDLGRTTIDVFRATREDIGTVLQELWSSLTSAFITLYNTVTIAKIIQILMIGLLLSSFPKLLEFFIKALCKSAKIN